MSAAANVTGAQVLDAMALAVKQLRTIPDHRAVADYLALARVAVSDAINCGLPLRLDRTQ